MALTCLGAGSTAARQGTGGPTRIAIAAGTVTDAQSRAGMVGTWEPDADLGAPPGANQVTYFADGLYLNPLRNIALVGLWNATARTLTLTPLEVRNLESTAPVPEMKEVLAQITWEQAETSTLTWLDPDRHRESGSQYGRRRVRPARDLTVLHVAALTALLAGTWVDDREVVATFLPGGLYREHLAGADPPVIGSGFHRVDATTGALHVTIERVDGAAAVAAAKGLTTGSRAPAALRWIGPGELEIAGVRWRRERPYVRGAGGWMR